MASIKEIAQDRPFLTATVGATGGLGGGWLSHVQDMTAILQLISVLFGSFVAVGAFMLTLPRMVRFIRNAWKRGLADADRDSEPPFPPTK